MQSSISLSTVIFFQVAIDEIFRIRVCYCSVQSTVQRLLVYISLSSLYAYSSNALIAMLWCSDCIGPEKQPPYHDRLTTRMYEPTFILSQHNRITSIVRYRLRSSPSRKYCNIIPHYTQLSSDVARLINYDPSRGDVLPASGHTESVSIP